MSGHWLVVGLGNPGPDYEGTRHNVGQVVVDQLAGRHAGGRAFGRHRSQAVTVQARMAGAGFDGEAGTVVLAKPTTYMNVSGGPVAGLVRYFGVEPARLVVVHDELDIDFGAVRVKRGGGSGGHNGLKSVTASLGGPDYLRVRVGIGRPPGRMDPADFVLRRFATAERSDAELLVVDAADAVETLVAEGLEAAQQRFHARA